MIKLWGNFLPSIEVGSSIELNLRDFQLKNPGIDILESGLENDVRSRVPIDINKLSKYIRLHARMDHRINDVSSVIFIPFKRCSVEDFEQNGI
jgi:hypothetical protein